MTTLTYGSRASAGERTESGRQTDKGGEEAGTQVLLGQPAGPRHGADLRGLGLRERVGEAQAYRSGPRGKEEKSEWAFGPN